jgi:TolB protein
MASECLLPAYSPTGREVSFTSFLRGGADLWIVPAGGGRARYVSHRSGMNSGAVWYNDGASLALTLSFEGDPEIYKIRASDAGVVQRLTHSGGSDLSPSLSGDGGQIAFVSDRQGTPQIYLMGAGGGAAKRLTFQGNQNTTPKFNPRADKPLIAFTGRDERGSFDIFTYDLKSGKIDRMTQNQGSNYDPAWSPDGRLLVYGSSRGGLYVLNPETRHELQIFRGGAHSPSWGPAPPQR